MLKNSASSIRIDVLTNRSTQNPYLYIIYMYIIYIGLHYIYYIYIQAIMCIDDRARRVQLDLSHASFLLAELLQHFLVTRISIASSKLLFFPFHMIPGNTIFNALAAQVSFVLFCSFAACIRNKGLPTIEAPVPRSTCTHTHSPTHTHTHTHTHTQPDTHKGSAIVSTVK